jgi:hypothetical protein
MSRDALLAIGVTLFVLGIILRGVAREHGRTVANRKLHELDTTKAGERAAPELSHFEKHLGTYASGMAVLGTILTVVAFFR